DVRNNHCYFTRFDFLRRFGNHLEQQRVDVVSAWQQDVFLWATLAAFTDELVPVLEVVVSGERLGDVVAWIERSAVECFHETDAVFVNHRRVEKTDHEETGFGFSTTVDRSRLRQDAIDAGGENVDLRTFLTASRDELFGVLEVAMVRDRFTEQAAGIERIAVSGRNDTDFALRNHCRFADRN